MALTILCALFLLGGPWFDYEPIPGSLNGEEVRGFRPDETAELAVGSLGDRSIMVFTGLSNRLTAVYSRTRAGEGEEWSEPVRISAPEALFDSLPSLYVDGQDVVHCVWQSKEGEAKTFAILYSKRDPVSGEWSAPVSIEGGGIMRSPVWVGGDSRGILFVVSHNRFQRQPYSRLQVHASYDRGEKWEELEPFSELASPEVHFWAPQLVADGERIFLLALRGEQSIAVLLTSSADGGKSWSSALKMNSIPSQRVEDPRMVVTEKMVQVTWVDQPDTVGSTKRLDAAFVEKPIEGQPVERHLIAETKGLRKLSYSVWREAGRVGVTWLEISKRKPSRIRQIATMQDETVALSGITEIAESPGKFVFEEFAASKSADVVLATEKEILKPTVLLGCRRLEEKTSWECEKIHTTSGSSDILSPLLIADGPVNEGYRVVFHEVRRNQHYLGNVLDTTISTGKLILRSGRGEMHDGGGNQGDASNFQFH